MAVDLKAGDVVVLRGRRLFRGRPVAEERIATVRDVDADGFQFRDYYGPLNPDGSKYLGCGQGYVVFGKINNPYHPYYVAAEGYRVIGRDAAPSPSWSPKPGDRGFTVG